MRLAVVIPAHCHPDILRFTLGSLLQAFRAYDLDIHVGFHTNYADYCQDTSIFADLRGVASVHLVDEIDWQAHNFDVNRYSKMHARQIEFLFQQIRYCDFDYVLLLDNDVFVSHDFVDELNLASTRDDLIGVLFDDASGAREGVREDGTRFVTLPKIAPWHLLLSKRLYQYILRDTSVVQPKDVLPGTEIHTKIAALYGDGIDLPLFFDTFAEVLHRCFFEWEMSIRIVPTAALAQCAVHFFFSSFNYGQRNAPERAAQIQRGYRQVFPAGVQEIFAEYRQRRWR